LWYHAGAEKASDFGAFQISTFHIMDTQPVIGLTLACHTAHILLTKAIYVSLSLSLSLSLYIYIYIYISHIEDVQ
jgi:hypothetical protein